MPRLALHQHRRPVVCGSVALKGQLARRWPFPVAVDGRCMASCVAQGPRLHFASRGCPGVVEIPEICARQFGPGLLCLWIQPIPSPRSPAPRNTLVTAAGEYCVHRVVDCVRMSRSCGCGRRASWSRPGWEVKRLHGVGPFHIVASRGLCSEFRPAPFRACCGHSTSWHCHEASFPEPEPVCAVPASARRCVIRPLAQDDASGEGVVNEEGSAREPQLHDLSSAMTLAEVGDTEQLCRKLGVQIAGAWRIVTCRPDIPTGCVLGRIFCIGGHSLKCVCAQHKECNLFLSTRTAEFRAVERTLLLWVCAGYGQTAAHHGELRDSLLQAARGKSPSA